MNASLITYLMTFHCSFCFNLYIVKCNSEASAFLCIIFRDSRGVFERFSFGGTRYSVQNLSVVQRHFRTGNGFAFILIFSEIHELLHIWYCMSFSLNRVV